MALVWYFGVNRLQTAANVDLAARAEVFSGMVMYDAQFRERIVATVRDSNDPDLSARKDSIAALLQSLAVVASSD
ncbi:hypothetical protein LCGC14_0204980 [marine sediment metagenome]|uniref:Uncharacterized protein n=1 Tax=marine sediment metagenome TaxID=412755 RepID=A0A0F9UHP3_9ZZZZ|nr:hypothetical protein [Phycisphaerae bacterium]HDZ43306.1 hypothetical protein [Phycisphaerae bacterium]